MKTKAEMFREAGRLEAENYWLRAKKENELLTGNPESRMDAAEIAVGDLVALVVAVTTEPGIAAETREVLRRSAVMSFYKALMS